MRQHQLSAGVTTWNYTSITDVYKESYRYNANGNILSLLRNGTTENRKPLQMDQLSYSYLPNSNKLSHVLDEIADGNYAEDIDNQAAGNYRYDKIGNLIQDVKEGITDIQWTVYGKIRSVTKSNGTTITYSYDAAGNRIAKAVTTSGVTTTTYYVRDAQGNTLAIYEGASKKEQYLYGSSRLGVYNPAMDQRSYELTNHLGNVLATVSEHKVNTGTSQEADVLSMQDYYAGGMTMPNRSYTANSGSSYRYGFNGKELDNEVVQYDYGFRIYDPRLVRFKSVDPLMKNYPMLTPYQFASNTPIAAIDLDGLEAKVNIEVGYVNKQRTVIKIPVALNIKVQIINLSSDPNIDMYTVKSNLENDLSSKLTGTFSSLVSSPFVFAGSGKNDGVATIQYSKATQNYNLMFEATTSASVEVIKDKSQIASNTLVYVIRDEIYDQGNGMDEAGLARPDLNVAGGEAKYYDYRNINTKGRDLAFHEVLHLLGAEDTYKDPNKKNTPNVMNTLDKSNGKLTSEQVVKEVFTTVAGPWNYIWNVLNKGNYKQPADQNTKDSKTKTDQYLNEHSN